MIALARAGLAVATAACAAALALGLLSRRPGHARLALAASAAGLLVATAVLARALWTSDLSIAYVADHSRREISAPYRLAGVWGGASGSLLLFTALLALVAVGGARSRGTVVAAAATCGLLLVALQTLADPFLRLDIPAIDGAGLQPILEHPAMLYHPPIVYVGLVLLALPAWRTLAAGLGGQPLDRRWVRSVRLPLLASWVLLTTGLATGANWAYVELGWGGYWGWDPVENGVLVPWLATLVALHLLRRTGPPGRLTAAAALAPWPLVLVGVTLTRSGVGASVHAFADDADLGWLLLAATVMTAAAGAAAVMLVSAPGTPPCTWRAGLLAAAATLGTAAAVVVFVGLVYPVPAPGSPIVSGHFFAVLLAPIAVAGAVGAVIAFVRRPRPPWPVAVAHAGFVILLVGIIGSTQRHQVEVTLDAGARTELGGLSFEHVSVAVAPGPVPRSEAVVAELRVWDGDSLLTTLHPRLVAYLDRGVLLAETGLHSRPGRDVQVVLRSATDAGAGRYELAVRPLVMLVWWGAALMTVGALATLVTATVRGRRQTQAASPGRHAHGHVLIAAQSEPRPLDQLAGNLDP